MYWFCTNVLDVDLVQVLFEDHVTVAGVGEVQKVDTETEDKVFLFRSLNFKVPLACFILL